MQQGLQKKIYYILLVCDKLSLADNVRSNNVNKITGYHSRNFSDGKAAPMGSRLKFILVAFFKKSSTNRG